MERHPNELTHPVHGEWLTMREIAAKYGVPIGTIRQRYYALGWQGDDLAKPSRPKKFSYKGQSYTLLELAQLSGLSKSTIQRRWWEGLREDDLVSKAEIDEQKAKYDLIADIAKRTGIKRNTLHYRWRRGARGADLEAPVMPFATIAKRAYKKRKAVMNAEIQARKTKNDIN